MELQKILVSGYLLGGSVAVVLLGAVLFEKSRKINAISALMLFFLSWWGLGYYFWLRADWVNDIKLAEGFLNGGFFMIAITFYFWVSIFLNKVYKKSIWTGYLLSFAWLFFYWSNLYYGNLEIFNLSSLSGVIFATSFILIYGGFYFFGIIELIRKALSNEGRDRKIKNIYGVIILLSILSFIFGVANLSIFYGATYFICGGLISMWSMFILMAYVIIKNTMTNMRVFFIQAIVSLILIVDVLEIFFGKTMIEVVYRLVMFLFVAVFFSVLIKKYKEDIGKKEKLEKIDRKLEINNRKLKELDNAKNYFMLVVAHQLRTPPTIIKGYLSLAKEDPNNNLDAETKDSIERACASNERLIELVENILNISRIESGTMQYKFQPDQSLEKIVQDLKPIFEIKATAKGLELILEIVSGKIPNITMDTQRIKDVISNLMDNAIKYTSKGSVKLEMYKTDYNMVRIEVSDTGMGILKNEIGELFNKFSRGSNAEDLASGGLGLGIYVGKKIIQSHHGKIWAQSAGEGKGATFIVELPINLSIEGLGDKKGIKAK
jgi:signal transduction histidine kinase